MSNDLKPTAAKPQAPEAKGEAKGSDPNALSCPTCGGNVDPRRTTQALSRNARLLLFCTSGCLRQFLATERAEKEAQGQ